MGRYLDIIDEQTLTEEAPPEPEMSRPAREKREISEISPAEAVQSLAPLADLPLLPEDREFIRRRLAGIRSGRLATLEEYRRRWLIAAQAEPMRHKKENRARYSANTWLLTLGA